MSSSNANQIVECFVHAVCPHESNICKRRKCEALSTFLDYTEHLYGDDSVKLAPFKEIQRRQEQKVSEKLMDAIDRETLHNKRFGTLFVTLDSRSEVFIGLALLNNKGYSCVKDRKKNTIKIKLGT